MEKMIDSNVGSGKQLWETMDNFIQNDVGVVQSLVGREGVRN